MTHGHAAPTFAQRACSCCSTAVNCAEVTSPMVPLMVLDGEPFFGQDRFDLLVWRLEQKDLKRRNS